MCRERDRRDALDVCRERDRRDVLDARQESSETWERQPAQSAEGMMGSALLIGHDNGRVREIGVRLG
jgi:hypothetical protein